MPKYCPKCGHSFPDDWGECNECEVELVYEEKDRIIELSDEDKKYYDYKSREYLNREFVKRGEPLTFEAYPYKQAKDQHVPKCPTCSSTNIEKISSFDKAAGAVMFGLFSKTARSQFKCRNCGYKR